ncbi:MAG TPA: hypothetical protein ENI55_04850 [Alphaproteobacteria bacterium]|nr:hypothetical protein [Alphaproteobacteria bacterium]
MGWVLGFALLSAAVALALTPALAIGISQCVTLVGGNGNKRLINRCPVCRIAGVERMRPGDSVPVYRKFTLPKNSRISVSLYGPGRSRIISDTPCAAAGKRNRQIVRKAGTCVRFNRNGGSLVLANSCQVCRSVLLERTATDRSRSNQSFAIAARSVVPVAANGSVSAKIINERSCLAGSKSARALGPSAKAAARLEALAARPPKFNDQAVETKRSWRKLKSRVIKKKEDTVEALATARKLKADAKNNADDAAGTVRELLNR